MHFSVVRCIQICPGVYGWDFGCGDFVLACHHTHQVASGGEMALQTGTLLITTVHVSSEFQWFIKHNTVMGQETMMF